MLRNYIITAWRNLKRDKSYSFINTVGLSIAVCAFLFISLFVYDELSYDTYHDGYDRIYRVYDYLDEDAGIFEYPLMSYLLAPTIEEEIAEVESVTRISTRYKGALITSEHQKEYEAGVLLTDPSIFNVFSFPFVQGDPGSALNKAFTMVISETAAKKYFPDENPMGKVLDVSSSWGDAKFEITGVVQDVPLNSHFTFDFLTSLDTFKAQAPNPQRSFETWSYGLAFTYIKLREGASLEAVNSKLNGIIAKYYPKATSKTYRTQALTDIHLTSQFSRELEPNSDIRYVYIFGSVAILILIIACINYTNLATAKGFDRALEIGIRKTLGVQKRQLFAQHIVEATVYSAFSILLALFLSESLIPIFNNVTGKSLMMPYTSPSFFAAIIIFIGVLGLFSGSYPAFVLSRLTPDKALRGSSESQRKSMLRNGLMVFQFSISLILIISTVIIQNQLNYVQSKKLGLNNEQVVVVEAGRGLNRNFSAFKDELLRESSIQGVSSSNSKLPVTGEIAFMLYPEGGEMADNSFINVGEDFIETLDIGLLQGQNVDELAVAADADYIPVLINKAAVRSFGWENEDPIGKRFAGFSPTPQVVGVVEDFHYESLKKNIAPILIMKSNRVSRYVLVKTNTADMKGTLNYIEEAWNKIGPGTPFTYSFLDEDYNALYNSEDKLAKLFSYFTSLSIVIACLGLFGLAAFTVQRRTKEIGIRKVLGASVASILSLFSKDYIKLVFISFTIAFPISYILMNSWLQNFAYGIEVGAGVFVFAGAAILGLVILTIGYQSLKTANMNPIDSLRSE